MLDSVPYDAILNANNNDFSVRALPRYYFDKAKVIVSFGADFLANWGDNSYATDYVNGRNPKSGKMSKHYQIETNLSLTGSNADMRIQIKPSEQKYLLSNLYRSLDGSKSDVRLSKIVKHLKSNKGSSIVVSDSTDEKVQRIVNAINHKLGNYSNTIDITKPSYLKQGDSQKVLSLINQMKQGNISALGSKNATTKHSL